MPLPTFLAGKLTAAALNAAFRGVGAITAYKPSAGTSITSNVTPAADPDMTAPLPANQNYALVSWLNWTSTSSTPDVRIDFSGTATMTLRRSFFAQPTSQTTSIGSLDTGVNTTIGNDDTRQTINGDVAGIVLGWLSTGATAGSFTLRVAQGTSDAAGVFLGAGCWMLLIPLD